MTAPAIQEQDPLVAAIKLMKEHRVPLNEIEAYVAKKRGHAIDPATTSHTGKPFVNAPSETGPGVGTKTLGVIAALNRDIPGAEAAQAGIRALVRRQPYDEARADIRGAEDAAPLAATLPARLVGGGMSLVAPARALGLGAKTAGALYGALSGLTDSDPGISKEWRAGNTIGGAAVGALGAGALNKIGGKVGRPLAAAGKRTASAVADRIGSFGNELTLPPEVLTSEGTAPFRAVRPSSVRAQIRSAPPVQSPAPSLAAPVTAPLPSPTASPAMDIQLRTLLSKAKAQNPLSEQAGNQWGDAELAMGQNKPEPSLEEQLRASIKMLGGSPIRRVP